MNKAYELAQQDLGTWEWADGHNPKVVQYFADVGHEWVKDDETAWCAAFVGAMIERSGGNSTRKLNARSYLEWGEPVELADAKEGDIVVFSRGDPNGWQGHVGFFVKRVGTHIEVLGGNQSNQVNKQRYPVSRLLSVRRAKANERTSVAQTKTAQASTAQVIAGASSVGGAIAALDGQAQQIAIIGGLVLVAFGLWFFRNRLRDFANGVR